MANNGGNIPSGRLLPPQAPSSRPPSSSGDDAGSNRQHHHERKHKGHRSRSNRVRSSSDGVRVMNERYQQQQQQQQQYQQYYGGGGGGGGGYQQGGGGGGYPMQYPNQPPLPPGPPLPPQQQMSPQGKGGHLSRSSSDPRREGSSDMNNGMPPGYGSIPPSPPTHVRKTSKDFSAMAELTSVMGGNQRGNISPSAARNARPRGMHRRTASDSMAMRQHGGAMPLPPMPSPYYQGNNQVVMPNPAYQGGGPPLRTRADSHGSQASQRSYHGPDPAGEMDAILARHRAEGGGGGTPSGGKRSSMHMRQNSVNTYMNRYKGEVQPRKCRDALWGALFVAQLAIMCVVGMRFGPEAIVATSEELGPGEGMINDDEAVGDLLEEDAHVVLAYRNIVKMAYTCGAFGVVVSALALAFMMAMSRRLVYVALVLSIGVSFAWGTIGIGISPKSFVPITGIIALMLTVGYMFVVWDRIPFASANLTTALTGVRDNLGLVGVAFFFQLLALVCSIYYSFTFVGLHDALTNGEMIEVGDNGVIAIDVLLLVSFYWTYQVLRHIVMVTVAGTIGSWWFAKPSALKETFLCATFHNFGSLCYGSLFVGPVQFLRQLTEGLRPNSEDSSMMCLYECSLFFQRRIVGCVDNLADSFTPWAFTYVGMYHYGLKDAGHKANEMFEMRGWSRIVTDDLIASVLAMVSLVIGGLCGSFAVILQALDGHGLTSFGHPVATSFTIGFVVGIVLSTVLFSIIDSSVCAVIVCFAGSPVEFHRNHMALSHEMRHAWKEVWPGSLDVDNMGQGHGQGVV